MFKDLEKIRELIIEKEYSSVKKLLTKINNPVYYKKYIFIHPSNREGYHVMGERNIWLSTMQELVALFKNDSKDLDKKLQICIDWFFQNKGIDLYVKNRV